MEYINIWQCKKTDQMDSLRTSENFLFKPGQFKMRMGRKREDDRSKFLTSKGHLCAYACKCTTQ